MVQSIFSGDCCSKYLINVLFLNPKNKEMDSSLLSLAKVVLPEEILNRFEIVAVERTSSEIHIHLDETMDVTISKDSNFESKGFLPATSVTDFPIRDHKVILLIRRRRWIDKRSGNSFVLPIEVSAEGSRYSKEFAAFLKETYGCVPCDLQYA